jgi:hypothetical protein
MMPMIVFQLTESPAALPGADSAGSSVAAVAARSNFLMQVSLGTLWVLSWRGPPSARRGMDGVRSA